MAKKDMNVDRWTRGTVKKSPVGAYTTSRTFKDGDTIGKEGPGGKVDRSTSPDEKPYGSMHYPATKDG